MAAYEDPWLRLARRVGLQLEYRDGYGRERTASRVAVEAVLSAMGYGGDPVEAELRVRLATEARFVEPVLVQRQGETPLLTVVVPAGVGGEVMVRLRLEDDRQSELRFQLFDLDLMETVEIAGISFDRRSLPLPADLPLGYHRIETVTGGHSGETTLIVAPLRAWRPWDETDEDARYWGVQVQLYALRSPRNWGIGDFTDLEDLVDRAAAMGAAAIGINPVHALFPDEPERVSPYSPSTRLYRNYLYLDVEAVEAFQVCGEARELVASIDFQRELGRLRSVPLVEYSGVASAKLRVLRLLHAHDQKVGDRAVRRAFEAYRGRAGSTLRRLAVFEVLRATLSAGDWSKRDWRSWDEPYRDPDSPDVAAFALEHADEVAFHEWLQFQIELQMQRVAERTRAAGMPLGIYADLAVGADAGGGEAWWNQRTIVSDLSIGAPPDLLSPGGQNWGLPLFHPVALREQALRPFISMLRANVRAAGCLRIDHVLGLLRLYCIPRGLDTADGLYVRYPADELLAVIALESWRNRCLIIGEDLGTLPPGLPELLAGAGILSYKVLYFEQHETRDGSVVFRDPAEYPREALACVSTHDLPPLAQYWRSDDLKLRARLGMGSEDLTRRAVEHRVRERAGLLELAGEPADQEAGPPVRSLHQTLARGASRLVMIQFEDLLPESEQVNLPGTYDEYPNWRRKLPFDLAALFGDRRVLDVLEAVADERPSAWRIDPEETVVPEGATSAGPRLGATYRLQFNAEFPFAAANGILPYLKQLGITHVYASSYLSARAGSTHGYDVTDHGMINPEVGGEEQFTLFADGLRRLGMGQILDFVPNHMGISRSGNVWWLDMLEWGFASPFARHFDVDWLSPRRLLRGKVLLPVLGDHYGAALERGELTVRLEETSGTISAWYFEERFPLRPDTYGAILSVADHPALQAAAADFAALPSVVPKASRDGVRVKAAQLKSELAQLVRNDPAAREAAVDACAQVSADFAALHAVLERQYYRLSFWRTAADEINYRRFFDINDLAAIRIEVPEVFEAVHRGLARLLAEEQLQGLRIDHIDGLADPAGYLVRLQEFAARYRPRGSEAVFPVWVEKILAPDERLRAGWPVAGTTGYEVAALLTGLQIDPAGADNLTRTYREVAGEARPFEAVVLEAKREVMETMLASEAERLANQLDRLAKQANRTRDFTLSRLHRALTEIVAGMDVYRTYTPTFDGEPLASEEDRRRISRAVGLARRRWHGADRDTLSFVERALNGDLARDPAYRTSDVAALIRRFQQYSGPAMAKSVEDTAFYRYARLPALTEVGADPERLGGVSVDQFHAANIERARDWPMQMLTSSTHDTKRGEDARARLAVLSELSQDWDRHVREWMQATRAWRGQRGPTDNETYLILQNVLAAWPMDTAEAAEPAFAERMREYVVKAVREAKYNTSWTDPDKAYEQDCVAYVDSVLSSAPDHPFRTSFAPFQQRVAQVGALNGIAQTVLRLTIPGVPDIYQGCALWNFSLADPDNRRPVDYAARRVMMADARPAWEPEDWISGRVKQHVVRSLLHLRQRHPNLFGTGQYRPLAVEGEHAGCVVAFTRSNARRTLLVLAGRYMAGISTDRGVHWGDTKLTLPPLKLWREVLTGRRLGASGQVPVSLLLDRRPASVWIADVAVEERTAPSEV